MTRSIALIMLVLVGSALFAADPGDTVAISVREGELRSSAGFLSRIRARLAYGTSVMILARSGDWAEVVAVASDEHGWVHASAIAAPAELNLTGQTSGANATSEEIALAGRGFSEQVEREYREENELNFAGVDAMETYLVPLEDLGRFLSEIDAELAEEGSR